MFNFLCDVHWVGSVREPGGVVIGNECNRADWVMRRLSDPVKLAGKPLVWNQILP